MGRLNNSWKAGLSSYAILLIVLAYLQHLQKQNLEYNNAKNLGKVFYHLINFLTNLEFEKS